MKRTLLVTLIIAVVALVALGCGGDDTATETTAASGAEQGGTGTTAAGDAPATVEKSPGVDPEKKVVKIAVLGPMSGTYGEFGKSQQRGAEIFNELELPLAEGPLAGFTFEYTYFDGKGDPKEATNIAQQIVIGDYFATVGSSLSLEALAAAPILDRENITLYTTFAASSKLTTSGWKNVLMSFPVAEKEGAAGAEIIVNKLGYKRVVEFYENSPYGQGLHNGFTTRMEELGGEVLESFTHDAKSDVSFSSPLTKVKELNPDAIFLSEIYESAGIIINQARRAGIDVPIAAASGALDKTAVEMAGGEEAVSNVLWLSLFSPESSRPKVQEFVDAYKAKFNLTPDDPAALTYDALLGIKTAMEAGVGAREELAAKLRSADMPTAEGITNPAIKHDQDGNIVGSELLVIKYQDGEFRLAE